MNYTNVGNIPETAKIVQREVRYIGLLEEPNLVLKFYDIHFSSKPTNETTLNKVKDFLQTEIREGSVDPHVGLGFAILTNDTLNLVRWNKEYPILVQNQQYGFNRDYTSAKLLDIRENNVGSFCIWEIGVTDFERKVWRKFVDSERSENDKKEYLLSVIEGVL